MICNKDCFNCQMPDCTRDEKADINEQKAEWRKNNPANQKAIRKRSYINHQSKEIEYSRNYRAEHLEEIRAKDRVRKQFKRERQAG